MLAFAVILLFVGVAAILLPILLTDMEMVWDADEYVQLKQQNGYVVEETFSGDMEIGVSSSMTSFPLLNSGNVSCTEAATRTNVNLSACQAQNADFVAWLQIPGTAIDYPVVWSDDADYYLNHTFAGKKSYIGTLFSVRKTDYSTPSRNIAIYGHHIRSNDQIMFSPLLAYKDAAFYAEHKIVYLDTLYHTGVYTVFAVINMRSGDWEPSTADFTSDEASSTMRVRYTLSHGSFATPTPLWRLTAPIPTMKRGRASPDNLRSARLSNRWRAHSTSAAIGIWTISTAPADKPPPFTWTMLAGLLKTALPVAE